MCPVSVGDVGAYFWKGIGQIPHTCQFLTVLTRQKQAAQRQRACFKERHLSTGVIPVREAGGWMQHPKAKYQGGGDDEGALIEKRQRKRK